MAKQLVVSGNRILAYGDDCFICMGGTVICPDTGKVYQNATVVNYEGALPFDIDTIGYEYHAGAFVPCAPFGVGDGNIAVVCGEDCKAVKDSGRSMQYLGRVAELTYKGTGNYGMNTPNTVTVDFKPEFAIVTGYNSSNGNYDEAYKIVAVLTKQGGFTFLPAEHSDKKGTYDTNATALMSRITTRFSDNSIEWYSTESAKAQASYNGTTYTITVFGN